jgi:hypothetical protein
LWVLGLAVMVLFLGGISLDLWRAFEMREDLAAMADSAANAGASQVDGATYRETGTLRLDGPAAAAAADANLDAQQDAGRITARDIVPSGPVLTVQLEGEVEFTLLRIFLGPGSVTISATGSAEAFPAL